MNQEQINKQIFRRLEKLEKRVFKKDSESKQKRTENSSKTTLPSLIIKLRDSGFFKKPQSANDVYKKLLPTYSCKIDRVNMALKRLKDRKKIRIADKIVKGKKVLAYVW